MGVGAKGPGFNAVVVENNVRNIECEWSPNAITECEKMIYSRLWGVKNETKNPKRHARWMFWGDSTIGRLFNGIPSGLLLRGDTVSACPSKYTCQHFYGGRCSWNLYQEAPPNDFKWTKPDFSVRGEGPVAHGLENPFCTDCGGCNADFSVCQMTERSQEGLIENRENLSQSHSVDLNQMESIKMFRYGGYVPVEFARDVELQSPEFGTTQEIMVSFLRRKYNTETLLEEFGLPICVLSTGIHDMAIPNITISKFLVNVKWYLDLLKTECSLFIWIANTAPETDKYPQTKGDMRQWNKGVRDVLQDHFPECSVFVDVFHSSIHWPHVDNIHMDQMWYSSLGGMLGRIIIGDTTPASMMSRVV
jgi:hypothetical protein